MSSEIKNIKIDGEGRKINPIIRRSSSLDSKGYNFPHLRPDDDLKNSHKFASTDNLLGKPQNTTGSDSQLFRSRVNSKNNILESLFVNLYKDPKMIKNYLSRLHEDILKPANFGNEGSRSVMFMIGSNLKVDTDYEIFTISNYDMRVSEFMVWSQDNKKELHEEYIKGLNIIKQKALEKDSRSVDGQTEVTGLMIVNKNQQISSFLPNKTMTSFEVVTKIGENFVIEQARKTEKNMRQIVMTDSTISIFGTKKSVRLKYKFCFKHLYCDSQIPNSEWGLRIRGPFGDDVIILFSSKSQRDEWNLAIQSSISTLFETFKEQNTDITVFCMASDLNSSAPLQSKVLSVNGQTTGLELKKKAIEAFNQAENDINDLILTFNLNAVNRDLILYDEVNVMVLQEHIRCFGDAKSCTDNCIQASQTNVPSRTPFYLQYAKIKRSKPIPEFKTSKSKQFNLGDRWVNNVIPEWLLTLFSDIYYEGSQVEGIFRLSGVKSKSDARLSLIYEGGDDIRITEDIHTKANTLKKFFAIIDGSIFTSGNRERLITLSTEITSVDDFKNNPDQINKTINIVKTLPPINYNLLTILLIVIQNISLNEAVNNMSLSNLAVCLAPTILPEIGLTSKEDFLRVNRFFECVISLSDTIIEESERENIISLLKRRKPSKDQASIPTSNAEDILDADLNTNLNISKYDSTDKGEKVKESLSPILPKSNPRNIQNQNVNQIDYVDGKVNVHMRPSGNKRTSEDRYTVAITDHMHSNSPWFDVKTPDSSHSSPFQRQHPVTRKNRDVALGKEKRNEPAETVEVRPNKRTNSFAEITLSPEEQPTMESRRSSSSNVQTLVQKYEKHAFIKKETPKERNLLSSEDLETFTEQQRSGHKVTRNMNTKLQKRRLDNIARPIQPSTLNGRPRASASVTNVNDESVQEVVKSSKDGVTFI